jgi:peptidoglycan/LPS O-acetylase OafA/YrhL
MLTLQPIAYAEFNLKHHFLQAFLTPPPFFSVDRKYTGIHATQASILPSPPLPSPLLAGQSANGGCLDAGMTAIELGPAVIVESMSTGPYFPPETEQFLPTNADDEPCTSSVAIAKPNSAAYIAHLNGLRAMAFIGVFLFHFRYGCPGGFLGVDVFFVLSGYLMTRSIGNQIASGSFTYASFLVRRFWRLYPALLFTIIASMCMTYGFFSNELALEAAKSALASIFGVSNILFMTEQGYFGTASAFKPLLHTWSLSAEWQFYLIWPLILSLCARLAPNTRALWPLVLLCAASFAHAIMLAKYAPHAAFYMLSPRAFEFGLGALTSLPYVPRVQSSHLGNAMSVTGTALIALSFQFINSSHGAPAVIALPSLFGAIMIILSPSDLLANRIFVSPLLGYIGKISYSAYLVHWPVFVFYQNIYEHTPAPWYIAIIVAFSVLALSAVMFHTIEDEYRIPKTRRHVIVGLGLLVIALGISAHGIASAGWSKRLSGSAVHIFDNHHYLAEYTNLYAPTRQKLPGSKVTAVYGVIPTTTTKRVAAGDDFDAVVVGDSFCAPLAGVFSSVAETRNKTFLMISHHSCASFFDKKSLDTSSMESPNHGREFECKTDLRPQMLELIRVAKSKVVVLSSNWFATSQMWTAKRNSVRDEDQGDGRALETSQLEETIEILNNMGRKVILLGMVPGSHFNVRACMAASGPLSGLKKCPEVSRFKAPLMGTDETRKRMERRAQIRDTIRRVLDKPAMKVAHQEKKVLLIDPYDVMCNDRTGECLTARSGEPYYSDDMHLTANGTMLFKERIEQALRSLAE